MALVYIYATYDYFMIQRTALYVKGLFSIPFNLFFKLTLTKSRSTFSNFTYEQTLVESDFFVKHFNYFAN